MFGAQTHTNRYLAVAALCFSVGVAFPGFTNAQEYIYTYAPHSMIVQSMIQSSPDTPSDCVLESTAVVTGTSGPHLRTLKCRAHPSYGENSDNEGVFGLHGIVPPGSNKFNIVVDVYSESSSSGNLCAVVSSVVISDHVLADGGVQLGVRYDSDADDTIHPNSATMGPVSVSSSNRRVSLTATNVPLKFFDENATRHDCTTYVCSERYFRMEVYIQGCQRLCSFGATFSCCGSGTCTNIGKVRVLGVTLRFTP